MAAGREVDGVRCGFGYDDLGAPDLAVAEHADLHAGLELVGVKVDYVGVLDGGEPAEPFVLGVELRVFEPFDERVLFRLGIGRG